ncbi:TetR-like C-terminal domain-containing protein [Mycolicibacterium sphagni]|uniref:Tetracyclin repressor-like C-terminal domain-containing protein n=1 Tax=Mycolicibacterium sphagni TaxID=1786 RepID=A0ABX2JLQ7_9MYCO|nr:TetR-like C-terminal domain-containing protein [Mycolicibacterium sphagni]NTY58405.1 hypothetical protein [Mycolicibacterium sphagni]
MPGWRMEKSAQTSAHHEALPTDVTAATLEAIRRRGIDAFTLDDVAELTGRDILALSELCGDKEELAVRSLTAHYEDSIPLPDTGCLRDDMAALAHSVARFLSTGNGRLLMRLLVVDDRDWGAGETRNEFWQVRFQRVQEMFDRAEQRGEIRPDVNGHIAMQLMLAPLHAYALYLEDNIIEEETVQAIVEAAWRGVATVTAPEA